MNQIPHEACQAQKDNITSMHCLTQYFNASFRDLNRLNTYGRLVVISKKDEIVNDPSKMCPLMMLPMQRKILEKATAHRLYALLKENHRYSTRHCKGGFRKYVSMDSQLFLVMLAIMDAQNS